MSSPLDWIDDELAQLESAGLLRRLRVIEGPQTAAIQLDGKELINFGSNDYLGLANDQRLGEAARLATKREGFGAGASPLITGRFQSHANLERRLASFEGTEAALLFPSGFAANSGVVAALAGRGDCIFADEKNHASLIDGCRLSRALVHVYRHCDHAHLGELLDQYKTCRRRIIVTDTLFSMDGDFAPLKAISQLAREHDCILIVDEAHATGVFGADGKGLCEHFGVEDGVHARVGTLSKAIGCAGGFVAGSNSLIQWLVNRARPYVFSTAPPPANAAAAAAAIDLVEQEPARRAKLLERASALRSALREDGWNLGGSESQIIPIYLGEPACALRLSEQLRSQGLLAPCIRPPSVPAGESLLRISVSYAHTPEMIERLLTALRHLR